MEQNAILPSKTPTALVRPNKTSEDSLGEDSYWSAACGSCEMTAGMIVWIICD
jgi:hypothetical protein